jgi:hypothetical protein
MSDILTLIGSMHAIGITRWSAGGRVCYRSAAGKIAAEDLQTLRTRKAEILDFLPSSPATGATEPRIVPRLPAEPIPLTFPQQSRWKALRQFGKKPNTRVCANASRLSGALNIDCLQAACAGLVKQHEILRARIVPGENGITQVIADDRNLALEIVRVDATGAMDRQSAAQRLVEEIVNQPCDITADPLFVARLVRIDKADHVLVVALDHIIADAVSVGIVLRDVWTLYLQATRGIPLSSPKIPLQFSDYAVWEQKTNAAWLLEHGGYWRERLAGAVRTRIFPGGTPARGLRLKTGKASVRLSKELTEGLHSLGQREHTTLVMTVLAAYVALLSRWTETTDITLVFSSAGRHRPELNDTIGFFACCLYFRLQVLSGDSFRDLLRRVTREYYTALQHQDFGRNGLAWPEAEYTRTVGFNWHGRMRTDVHAAQDICGSATPMQGDAIRLSPFPFEKAVLDVERDDDWNNYVDNMECEPWVNFTESIHGISGWISYRVDAIPAHTMEKFTRGFRLIAQAGWQDPQMRVADLPYE